MLTTNMKLTFSLLLLLSGIVKCQMKKGYDPLGELIKAQRKEWHYHYSSATSEADFSTVHIGSQHGSKIADKIEMLPGQPSGVIIHQYSGYVTVDPTAGRELFYYFVESDSPLSKPLVLWLNGGPGCSSFGYGAMMELGPFRVNSDGKTLSYNEYAWSNLANMLFLESPAGVGFSYSNTSSDYDLNGDKRAAQDAYTFLVNWFERFPEYKNRKFFMAGESYAGHYVPQLAQKIIQHNKIPSQTSINLKGIAMGNAWIDSETGSKGMYDFFWTHALISDDVIEGINFNCNFTSSMNFSENCTSYLSKADASVSDINIYDIYAPVCSSVSSNSTKVAFDPCSEQYINSYLNNPEVQKSLHANVTGIPGPWQTCNHSIYSDWKDKPLTVLPTIEMLMTIGINVCIYSGDTDARVPTTSTRYSINKLGAFVETPWYPWYNEGEVGGYAVGYDQNLIFVTIRGAGHFVPSYQPARALGFFSSFLAGELPSSD